MGILSRSLLNVALDGRVTFMAAGAVLGVGVYGFAVTFKPYESGRVLEPFHVPGASLVANAGSAFDPSSVVFPEGAAAFESAGAPAAPGETLVAAAPPVARVASRPLPVPPPVVAAGTGDDGAQPLPPPAPAADPKPQPVGVQQIDPENVLVFMFPPREGRGDQSEVEQPRDDPQVHEPPDTRDKDDDGRSSSTDRGRHDKGGGAKRGRD